VLFLCVRMTGAQWRASYKTRLPYVTLAGMVAKKQKSDNITVSLGAASSIFSDSARGSAVHAGVQVVSEQFAAGAFPSALSAVTAKIESVQSAIYERKRAGRLC
jgi:hypothetical protein